jgi:hypothetical protein
MKDFKKLVQSGRPFEGATNEHRHWLNILFNASSASATLLRNLRRELTREQETIKLELERTTAALEENERIKQEFTQLVNADADTRESRRLEREELTVLLADNRREVEELSLKVAEPEEEMTAKGLKEMNTRLVNLIETGQQHHQRLKKIEDLTVEKIQDYIKSHPINVHEPLPHVLARSCIRKLGHGEPTGGQRPRVLSEEQA